MNREIVNYLRRPQLWLSPRSLQRLLVDVGYKGARYLVRRASGRNGNTEPPYLRSAPALDAPAEPFQGVGRILGASNGSEPAANIQLATRQLPWSGRLPWGRTFGDVEDSYALHRFGWLLSSLRAEPGQFDAEQALAWMGDWVRACPAEGTLGWWSYSISERVVNWILILLLAFDQDEAHSDRPEREHLRRSLSDQSRHLRRNLEYRDAETTNNHVINNGRALYFAGRYLGDDELARVGRAILLHESGNMFSASGFLREGSSHYQLLVARTYLEAAWVARISGDRETREDLQEPLGRILRAARLFLVRGKSAIHLPLLGDVSPDFPPQWLLSSPRFVRDVLEGPADEAWPDLWLAPTAREMPIPEQRTSGFELHSDAGWYRYDSPSYTILWHADPDGRPWFHRHNDITGFELIFEGKPLLVDPGRHGYRSNPLDSYGRRAAAHSAVVIDGLEPVPLAYRRAMHDEYLTWNVDVRADEATRQLSVEHDGFARLPDPVTVRRTFRLEERGLIIEDDLSGTRRHSVRSFFHLHPSIEAAKCTDGSVRLSGPDGLAATLTPTISGLSRVEVVRGRNGVDPAGWYFPQYGRKEPACTLIFEQRSAFPATNRFTLEVS